VKKRLSEKEITQLRDLLEKVSMENGSPQPLPTANGKLRRLCYIGEWAMIVIPCCTHFPLIALAFLVSLLSGNFEGAMALVIFNLMAWPLVLIFWVLPIILFFVFRFIQKKTYSDEVIQINQLIYEELRVRKYIEDKDLTEEARELKELYKRIWD
jgi:ATP-dependent clp protease, ATP-binding subunit clpB